MAQGTTVVLLPQTAYPGPPGVSISIDGTKQQAAVYILANRDLQTISWNLGQVPQGNNQQSNPVFIGNIYIQASIATDPTLDSDWFTVYQLDVTPGTLNVQQGFNNLVGNYVWLRATVRNWTQGAISLVAASY
jgi:hypothetical protein